MRFDVIRPAFRCVLRIDSDSSTGSAFTVDDERAHTKLSQLAQATATTSAEKPKRRRVHFAETSQVIADKSQLTKEEIELAWYSARDMKLFKYDLIKAIEEVRRFHARAPDSVVRKLQSVDAVFRCASTTAEIFNAMETSDVELSSASTRGLETHMLRQRERHMRKKGLMSQVILLQSREDLDGNTKAEMIRSACRNQSRSSVFFSFFLAERSARNL